MLYLRISSGEQAGADEPRNPHDCRPVARERRQELEDRALRSMLPSRTTTMVDRLMGRIAHRYQLPNDNEHVALSGHGDLIGLDATVASQSTRTSG